MGLFCRPDEIHVEHMVLEIHPDMPDTEEHEDNDEVVPFVAASSQQPAASSDRWLVSL